MNDTGTQRPASAAMQLQVEWHAALALLLAALAVALLHPACSLFLLTGGQQVGEPNHSCWPTLNLWHALPCAGLSPQLLQVLQSCDPAQGALASIYPSAAVQQVCTATEGANPCHVCLCQGLAAAEGRGARWQRPACLAARFSVCCRHPSLPSNLACTSTPQHVPGALR